MKVFISKHKLFLPTILAIIAVGIIIIDRSQNISKSQAIERSSIIDSRSKKDVVNQEDTKTAATPNAQANESPADTTDKSQPELINKPKPMGSAPSQKPAAAQAQNCVFSGTTVPSESVYVPYGQTTGSVNYTAAQGYIINSVIGLYLGGVDLSADGLGSSSVRVNLPVLSNPAQLTYIQFNTNCGQISMPIVFTIEEAPVINVVSISYDTNTNSILYSVDKPISSMSIIYVIPGCIQSAGFSCSSFAPVYTTAMSGSIDLDPLFPEIDTYFASNPLIPVSLTLSPTSAQGYSSGTVGQITFTF